MTLQGRLERVVLMGLVALVGLALSVMTGLRRHQSGSLLAQLGATPTPTSTGAPTATPRTGFPPIHTAQEAIDVAAVRIPQGHYLTAAPIARLLTLSAFDSWRGMALPGWAPATPIWAVGFNAEGLLLRDVLAPLAMADTETAGSHRPVDGVFYGLDARNGMLVVEGALLDSGPRSLLSLEELQNMDVTIIHITPHIIVPGTPSDQMPGQP